MIQSNTFPKFIKKHFSLVIAFLLVVIGIGAIAYSHQKSTRENELLAQIKASQSQPIAELDRTEFDWGEIPRDQIAEETFYLTNKGNMDMEVSKLVTSCGCTTAELWLNGNELEIPAIIPTNSKAAIEVKFDPAAHDSRGLTKRAVRIETNDPQNPFLIINLQANVQ